MARFFEPIMQAFDSSGNTIVSATLDFFEQGTTTPLDTFQDPEGNTPNANPVISGGGGLFPDIFLQSTIYTVVYKDADAVEIWSTDVDGTEDPLVTEAIASAGIMGTSDENLAEAIARYAATGGVFYEDNGAADAYVLAALGDFITPKALLDRMEVRFVPTNANTGASTVNVNSLGVKTIVNFDGTALAGGEIIVGDDITLVYDLANDRFKITSTASGGLKSVQVFETSGTWTKPSGISTVRVEVVGGGGGGAFDNAGGGGGGGTAEKLIDVTGTASETITVGTGGAGDNTAGGTGVTGGTSSFGAFCSATGGTGGKGPSASPTLDPGDGGIGIGGDLNIGGGAGSRGINAQNMGGSGGNSSKGGGGRGGGNNLDAEDGQNYGGGGGSKGGGGAGTSGDGADSVVTVWEYS